MRGNNWRNFRGSKTIILSKDHDEQSLLTTITPAKESGRQPQPRPQPRTRALI